MPPTKSSQTNKIIEVETYNVHSVNKVLVQQILETIGQITKKTLDRDPQQIMKLKLMILPHKSESSSAYNKKGDTRTDVVANYL